MSERLQSLEATWADGPLFARANEYQKLLDDVVTTEAERNDIVASLNKEWPYMHQPMILNGTVALFCDASAFAQNEQLIPAEDEFIEQVFCDLPVVSTGFSVIERPLMIAGEQLGVHYQLACRVIATASDGEGEVEGYGAMDRLALTAVTQSKPEQALLAEYFLAEDTEEIDTIVCNSEKITDAIKQLRTCRFAASEQRLDGMAQGEYYELLSAYLNHLIVFDTKVPYRVKIEGACAVLADDRTRRVAFHSKPECYLAYPKSVFVAASEEGEKLGQVYMELEVLRDQKDSIAAELPLTSLRGFVSLRDQQARNLTED